MKKFILTTSIVSLSLLSQAQISLFNNEVEQQWHEISFMVNQGTFCEESRLITKGEAVERDGKFFIPIIKQVGKEKDTVGFFRQDGQKYYYTQKNIGKEFLLYDFGLQEGDKVQIYDEMLQLQINHLPQETIELFSTHTVEKIDVVTDKNGVERKRIHLETGEYWIEGIGSPHGLTHSCVDLAGGGTQLLSYTENENTVLEFDCKCETLSIETKIEPVIISPNPVKDFLTLTLPTDNNEIEIFNLQGKLLLQQNVGFSAEIIVSMLQAGTYVLVVNGESYKFVKE